jgi:hypothetical protein
MNPKLEVGFYWIGGCCAWVGILEKISNRGSIFGASGY